MNKMVWISGASLTLALALVAGCATTGAGMSDEELVQMQLETWAQGLVEQDMDLFLSTVSENFSARQAPDKETFAGFIAQAMDAGYLEEAEVFLDDAQIVIEDDVASVYPVDLMSIAGSVAVEVVLTKEDGEWLVSGLDIDGL